MTSPISRRRMLRRLGGLFSGVLWSGPIRAQPSPTHGSDSLAAGTPPAGNSPPRSSLRSLFGEWQRHDRHDGYVVGNGRMYAVGALGRELSRAGKSVQTERAAGLTQLAWICGPNYGCANLGYGWEIRARVAGLAIDWRKERVVAPTDASPFWGVECQGESLQARVEDFIPPDRPVLTRKIQVSCTGGIARDVSLLLPVHPDSRNGEFRWWSGEPLAATHPLWRTSVPAGQLAAVLADDNVLMLRGAPRRLYQEISTPYPIEQPPAVAITGALVAGGVGRAQAGPDGLTVELGRMAPGDARVVTVWIVTAETTSEALSLFRSCRKQAADAPAVVPPARLPVPLLTRTDGADDPMLAVIRGCGSLVLACQARCGGVLAQPYMYPMYYVRDQYGSFKLMLALGEYRRAYQVLAFYIAMQNQHGIQNAYDAVPDAPDPTRFDPKTDYAALDRGHAAAEVPSYIILMARDYLHATGDVARIAPLYARLAYNVRCQRPSPNGVFPSPGDESYTNAKEAAPRSREEMADSSILFIAAARFMGELAGRLGHADDAASFRTMADKAQTALIERLWLPDGYFAYARDRTTSPAAIDRRPAFDALLRWAFLELGPATDPIPTGCLATIKRALVNPLRTVPEATLCTGMAPGYLLHAMARAQDPALHAAAELLLAYASDNGLFNEYYRYGEKTILPDRRGTLRPWESSIDACATIQYLLGLRVNVGEGRIWLQPHLPPGWPGWKTRGIDIPGEGMLRCELRREPGGNVVLTVEREGGRKTLQADIQISGYEGSLVSADTRFTTVAGRADLLHGELDLTPRSQIRLAFGVYAAPA